MLIARSITNQQSKNKSMDLYYWIWYFVQLPRIFTFSGIEGWLDVSTKSHSQWKKIEIKLHVMCDSATEWTYVRADGKLHTHTTHTYIYQPPLELRKYIYRNPLWLRVGRVGSLKKTENMASSASKYMMLSLSMDARCLFWYKTNFAPKWKIFPRTPTHVSIFVTLEYATDCTYLSSYRIVSASQQTWQHDIYIHQLWTSILWLCYDFWYICTQLAQI